jgi:hypothetical protein
MRRPLRRGALRGKKRGVFARFSCNNGLGINSGYGNAENRGIFRRFGWNNPAGSHEREVYGDFMGWAVSSSTVSLSLSLSLSLSPPPPPFFSVLSVCLAASGGELGSNGTHAWWVAGVGWQRERRGPFSQGDADVRYVSSSARIDRRCAHAKDHGRGASMHGRSWSVILYDETRLRLDQSTMSSSLSGQVVI